MAKAQFKKNYLDYYTVNEDYSGERHTNNKEEAVQFKQSSSIRIWYNNYKAIFPTYVGVIPRRCYYGFVRCKS